MSGGRDYERLSLKNLDSPVTSFLSAPERKRKRKQKEKEKGGKKTEKQNAPENCIPEHRVVFFVR